MSSRTSTTHPQSGQAAESPILIHQQTNHAGRLLLLTGAQGCPTGSTTGLLQWDSLQRSLVHGFGRLTTAPLRKTIPTRQSHRTADSPKKVKKQTKTNSGSNPPPEEERDKGIETEKGGASGGAKILQALVTLVSTAFSLPNIQHQQPK